MKREEIEAQIDNILNSGLLHLDFHATKDELTDLFIELSNERCTEQIESCYHTFLNNKNWVASAILNAPLPEIK